MQLQEEHTLFIRESFDKMKSKEDFLALLNFAKVLVYGKNAVPFEQKQINYHCNDKANKKRYIQFSVKKKSGSERIIHAPAKGLKAIQKCLNLIFQTIYDVSSVATGFVPGKSIVDNAKIHVGSLYVYNIDLKDFFPSIEGGRIWKRFQQHPFNLTEKSGRKDLANIITWLCCHEMEVERFIDNQWQKVTKNVLPQGAPTSPTLTNIICQQLDFYLSAVAKRFGLKYTRYADDITFSSLHNIYQVDSIVKNDSGRNFLEELHEIIRKQKFNINVSKTRLQNADYRQMVTGLLVNEKANVPKRYIKQLRMWIYYWEQYGYDRASIHFFKDYSNTSKVDRQLRAGNKRIDRWNVKEFSIKRGKKVEKAPKMELVIAGKLDYLKMVKGAENELYIKLKGRFDALQPKGKNEALESRSSIETDAQTKKLTISIVSSLTTNETQKLLFEKVLPTGLEIPYQEEFENKMPVKKKPRRIIFHKPLLTIEFLKNFKYDNNTGLKELVHKPFDSSSFNFLNVIQKAKDHPVFFSTFNEGQKSSDFKGELPNPIWVAVKKLIDLLGTEGLKFFNETNKHPIECPDLSKEIQAFKKNYRFGSEKTEYSILKELILNVARKVNHKDAEKGIEFSFGKEDNTDQFNIRQLTFLPDEKIFTMRAGFFTWVPNVKNALWWIFQGILQHSNIDGKREFDIKSKTIDIEIIRERIPEKSITQIRLVISDNKSLFKKSPEQLVTDLKGSEPYTEYLRGIADWIVEFDCEDGKSYSLNMLPEDGKIIQLENKVKSFKHIIKFYD